jgi:hypothetical protein
VGRGGEERESVKRVKRIELPLPRGDSFGFCAGRVEGPLLFNGWREGRGKGERGGLKAAHKQNKSPLRQ